MEGFLRYVQANPEKFENENELLEKVEMLVKERQWSKDYSRSLVLTEIQTPSEPLTYANHTGQYLEYIWRAQIENHRPDAAAVNTVCILDSIENMLENKSHAVIGVI